MDTMGAIRMLVRLLQCVHRVDLNDTPQNDRWYNDMAFGLRS